MLAGMYLCKKLKILWRISVSYQLVVIFVNKQNYFYNNSAVSDIYFSWSSKEQL